jgi:general secretion pathway protein K
MMGRTHHQRGVVLLVVLFFAVLLTGSIATFLSRATVDTMIVRNREGAARAEALARGGIRLATALLIEDRVREAASDLPIDSYLDGWSRAREVEIPAAGGAILRLRIEDSGARLNLNALFSADDGEEIDSRTEPFLRALLEKVIDEMPIAPAEKLYDVRELAANLIDYVDSDEVRLYGGAEDSYYQEQDPPYRAANRSLLSVDELRMVEGFDGRLVEALRPYVTVYPYAGGSGINLNTAPPHVLALLFFDDGVDLRLAREDTVREILQIHEDGGVVCAEGNSDERCTPIRQIVTNAVFPPPTFSSNVFTAVAEVEVGEVRRTVEAVIDRTEPDAPLLLSWRLR